MAKVITRFPPSPTGYFHIGSARTALFNYLFSKSHRGEMILRFEDTDKERNKPEFEKDIIDGLNWLGISYDNRKIEKQSERTEIYKKYIEQLINSGHAYISKEEEGDRKEVVRFKNPNTKVKFSDLIRGEVEFDTTDLKDFVIARSIDDPLYHLTVVVDDYEMEVTHVIRGEDHISNTPRQILILEALGFVRPIYAHIPLILAPDRSKMSKRHGAVSITEYKNMGYLPESIVNYLALLGWNPGDDREIFTIEELIKEFGLERVQKGGAIFNIEKLNWINKIYLNKLDDNNFLSLAQRFLPQELKSITNFDKLLPEIRERINKLSDINEMFIQGEFDFYINEPKIELQKITWKTESVESTREILSHVLNQLSKEVDFSKESLKSILNPYAEEIGKGKVLHPLRYSLSGKEKSPDPFTIASIIGKEETIKRLNKAIEKLK